MVNENIVEQSIILQETTDYEFKKKWKIINFIEPNKVTEL